MYTLRLYMVLLSCQVVVPCRHHRAHRTNGTNRDKRANAILGIVWNEMLRFWELLKDDAYYDSRRRRPWYERIWFRKGYWPRIEILYFNSVLSRAKIFLYLGSQSWQRMKIIFLLDGRDLGPRREDSYVHSRDFEILWKWNMMMKQSYQFHNQEGYGITKERRTGVFLKIHRGILEISLGDFCLMPYTTIGYSRVGFYDLMAENRFTFWIDSRSINCNRLCAARFFEGDVIYIRSLYKASQGCLLSWQVNSRTPWFLENEEDANIV